MKFEVLGNALGTCLARLGSLSAAYIPDGVSDGIVKALVRKANATRPSALAPFAILVSMQEENTTDSSCLQLTPQNAIRYRQQDRLAVVVGRHPDLASFMLAFRETLGKSYPANASGDVSLEKVAEASLDEIVVGTELEKISTWDREIAISRLTNCLAQLSSLYEHLGEGSKPWNAYWFEHSANGLSSLSSFLRHKINNDPALVIDEFFEKYTYASFSLPKPNDGISYNENKSKLKRKFVDSFRAWWSDEESIITTTKQLAFHPETDADTHPLESLDWTGFDHELGSKDNHLIAFQSHGSNENVESNNSKIEAFSELSETQFVNPLLEDENLSISSSDGIPLHAGVDQKSPPFILGSIVEIADGGQVRYVSEEIRIHIPTIASAQISKEEVQKSNLAITSSSNSFQINTNLELDATGALYAVGRVSTALGKKSPYALRVRSLRLTVQLNSSDALASKVMASASCEIYQIPVQVSGILVFPINTSGNRSKGQYLGPNHLSLDLSAVNTEESIDYYQETLKSPHLKHQVIAWSSENDQVTPTLNSRTLVPFSTQHEIFSDYFSPKGSDTVQIGDITFTLTIPKPEATCQSPIIAAIDSQPVSTEIPSENIRNSVRGLLENQLSELFADESALQTLGHMILPADTDLAISDLVNVNGFALSTLDIHNQWSAISSFEVPESLVASAEAHEFRSAFRNLFVSTSADKAHPPTMSWPSKKSWKGLWSGDRKILDQYLSSYTQLVKKAREFDDPSAIFWATYPFSASIWDTTSTGKCRAVLLSPLHPLRLTWLSSVEETLWESSGWSSLVGTIEGWNFPIIGPSETANGKMLAVPIDNGEGQLFLGWSMLVAASIDGTQSLLPPTTIGNLAAPGSAGSGLNATNASSALRNYRRMNPHVSTLTIDLASLSPTARLGEIDVAVVKAISNWNDTSQEPLQGGIRVLDSLNRRGEFSRTAAKELVRETRGVPFTWSRYLPSASSTQKCNIRLLQDSGVRMEVRTSGSENMGIIGDAPLRRFEVPQPPHARPMLSESKPALRPFVGWKPFATALNEVEQAHNKPSIVSRLFKAMLVDDRADWTVSGETMISPSALASLVNSNSSGNQMLLDWCPPFLDIQKDLPLLESRPSVSIARVPSGYRTQIRSMLDKATGTRNDDDSVTDLLSKLGARGVGLASLLSMGGTHATGALGFYLSFALLDQQQDESCNQFVVPIDACEDFLQALSKGSTSTGTRRRADLLVIRIDDTGVTLSPLEIKFYGLNREDTGLSVPKPGDSALEEAHQQLSTTIELLKDISTTSHNLQTEGTPQDYSLWITALGALVETGARLHPTSSSEANKFASRLHNLLIGNLEVRVGLPLINYFVHKPSNPPKDGYSVFCNNVTAVGKANDASFGLLAADAQYAFEAIKSADTNIAKEWADAVRWSAENSTSAASKDLTRSTTEILIPRPTENSPSTTSMDLTRSTREVLLPRAAENSNRTSPNVPNTDVQDFGTQKAKDNNSTVTSVPVGFINSPDSASGHEQIEPPSANIDKSGSAESVSIASPTTALLEVPQDGIRFPVGELLGTLAKSEVNFWPGNTELNQLNIGVVGDLGTGKTQLLKNLVFELRDKAKKTQVNPLSILIFDYKRDFQDDDFINSVGGKVLRPHQIPLNIFSLPSGYTPLAAFQRAQAFCDVISKIYSNIGYSQRERLVTAITDLFRENNGSAPTMSKILEAYRGPEGKSDSVTGILNTFVLGEIFSEDEDSLVSFDELIDDKVLVLSLSDLSSDQNSKNALVILFLNLYFEYMLRSKKWDYVGDEPQIRRLNSYLLVDEATNIMEYEFPVLMQLMLQGREFGFGVILASQYLSHYKVGQVNYGEPLLTWFIHKVPKVSVKELMQLGVTKATENTPERIMRQKVHEAYFCSLGYDGAYIREYPFYAQIKP